MKTFFEKCSKNGETIGTIIGIVKVTLSNNNHKWPTFRRFWRCRKYKMMCRYGQRLNQVHNQKRQFLFTKSTELIRRVSFTKQPSLINNKPVHFVFYRDVCRIIQPHIVSTTGIHEPKLVEQSNAYFFSFRSKWKQFYRYITGNILIGGIWTGMFVELDTLTEHDRY